MTSDSSVPCSSQITQAFLTTIWVCFIQIKIPVYALVASPRLYLRFAIALTVDLMEKLKSFKKCGLSRS